jgi:serine protease Do
MLTMKTPALNMTQLVAALLAAGAIGGAGVSAINTLHTQAAATVPATLVASAPMSVPDFSQTTERYGPAVVNISVSIGKTAETSSEAQNDEASSGDLPNDPFFEFFRRFQQGQSSPTVKVQASSLAATALF